MHKVMSKKIFILLLIVFFGGFLRFFKLDEYPIQLNHDEISQLYDMASIAQTGKDIYGNFLPLAFPSTGDFKIGHYIYLSLIPYLIFGFEEVTIRISSAFFGTLIILAIFLFVKVLTKNWTLALLSSFMISITPSEIFYSRKSFENVIGVFLVIFGLYFLIKSFEYQKIKKYGYFGILLLALAMYVYTSHTIIVPQILILTFVIFKKKLNLTREKILLLLLFWVISVIPLIYISLTNAELRFRAQSVFLTQDPNLGRLTNLTDSQLKSNIDHTFIKYINQFNPGYIFGNGLFLTNQGIIGVGPLMFIQLPLVILGIVYLIKKQILKTYGKLLVGLVLIGMIPSAITFEDFSPHRSIFAFTILSIISATGLYWLIKNIYEIKFNNLIKYGAYILICLLTLLNFLYFIRTYIFSYPFEKSQFIQYPFKQVAQYIWSQYDNFDTIIFDPKFGITQPLTGVGAHYYLAYYGNISPQKAQIMKLNLKENEMVIDKIHIRAIYWADDKDLKNTLIIGSQWTLPIDKIDQNKIIHTFDFYDGQKAFYAISL